MPLVNTRLIKPAVSIGDRTIVFPVEIESGCYLEFNSPSDCKLFNRSGKLLSDVKPQGPVPVLATGDNLVKFASNSPAGVSARANVTVISRGKVL